jgi:CRISPR-associated protein Cas2
VFEVVCTEADLLILTDKMNRIIDHSRDSIRIYRMHAGAFRSARTLGVHTGLPHREPIIL